MVFIEPTDEDRLDQLEYENKRLTGIEHAAEQWKNFIVDRILSSNLTQNQWYFLDCTRKMLETILDGTGPEGKNEK